MIGIPNNEVIILIGKTNFSEMAEKNSIKLIPKIILRHHWCHNFEGLKSNRQKWGMTMPMNKIFPIKAVTDVESIDVEIITKYFNIRRFIPKDNAYCSPRLFPMSNLIVLKTKNKPIKILINTIKSWVLDNWLFAPKLQRI